VLKAVAGFVTDGEEREEQGRNDRPMRFGTKRKTFS
jgi:hypothetical protein